MTVDERRIDAEAAFEVRVEPAREVVRVKPIGELALTTAPELREQVAELVAVGFEHVVIDLRGVSSIDDAAVALLLRLADQARSSGWRLSSIQRQDQVQRILALTGTRDQLPFDDGHAGNGKQPESYEGVR
jgi:anti-sigma B factor antagonist